MALTKFLKTGIKILISLLLIPNLALACNFNTDIQKEGDKYLYTVSCHKQVGKMYMDNKSLKKELDLANEAYKQRTIEIQKADEQMRLWRDESYEQHQRLLNVKSASDTEKWLWFGLGVVVMGAAVHGAGQLR